MAGCLKSPESMQLLDKEMAMSDVYADEIITVHVLPAASQKKLNDALELLSISSEIN